MITLQYLGPGKSLRSNSNMCHPYPFSKTCSLFKDNFQIVRKDRVWEECILGKPWTEEQEKSAVCKTLSKVLEPKCLNLKLWHLQR